MRSREQALADFNAYMRSQHELTAIYQAEASREQYQQVFLDARLIPRGYHVALSLLEDYLVFHMKGIR